MRFKGRITYYIPARNFGFIVTPEGKEFFFHASNFVGIPVLSMNVEFEQAPPIREGKGPQAVNVVPVSAVASSKSEGAQ